MMRVLTERRSLRSHYQTAKLRLKTCFRMSVRSFAVLRIAKTAMQPYAREHIDPFQHFHNSFFLSYN